MDIQKVFIHVQITNTQFLSTLQFKCTKKKNQKESKKKQNNKPRLFNSSFATWQDISPTLSNAVKDFCKKNKTKQKHKGTSFYYFLFKETNNNNFQKKGEVKGHACSTGQTSAVD